MLKTTKYPDRRWKLINFVHRQLTSGGLSTLGDACKQWQSAARIKLISHFKVKFVVFVQPETEASNIVSMQIRQIPVHSRKMTTNWDWWLVGRVEISRKRVKLLINIRDEVRALACVDVTLSRELNWIAIVHSFPALVCASVVFEDAGKTPKWSRETVSSARVSVNWRNFSSSLSEY